MLITVKVAANTDRTADDAVVFETTSNRAHFLVTLRPEHGTMPIGTLHSWILRVTDTDGYPLYPINLAIGGGMAAHRHGLPTQPQITDYLGDGEHRIEGVKFNMAGEWTLRVGIEYSGKRDIAEIRFDLDF